jgi:hypothetical protein
MDNASPGDWHVTFDVANFSGAEAPRYGRRIGGPPFPNPTGTQTCRPIRQCRSGEASAFPRFRKAKLSLWKSASPIVTRTRRSAGKSLALEAASTATTRRNSGSSPATMTSLDRSLSSFRPPCGYAAAVSYRAPARVHGQHLSSRCPLAEPQQWATSGHLH